MDELDEHSERLLAAFRDVERLDARSKRKISHRLERSRREPSPAWLTQLPEETQSPQSISRPSTARWWWLGAAAAVVITVGVASQRQAATEQPLSPVDAASHRSRASDSSGVASPRAVRRKTVPAPESTPTPRGTSIGALPQIKAPVRARIDRSVRSAPRPRPPGPKSAEVDLAAELAMLGAAEDALRSGDAQAALVVLDRYRSAFPGGQLQTDAHGLRTIAGCRLGLKGASRRAHLYIDTHSMSALTQRIEQACAAFEKSSTTPTDTGPVGQSRPQ